jgi:hypothetical protein
VACGYSQAAGINYDKNFAPVINDDTYGVLLIVKILWNLKGIIVDVEAAFLHGNLEGRKIYMDAPEGLQATVDKGVLLQKTIYGLIQSSQFYKKLVKILRLLGFKGGYSDPCLMTRCNKLGIIFIALYVDNCLCIGHDAAIKDSIKGMES